MGEVGESWKASNTSIVCPSRSGEVLHAQLSDENTVKPQTGKRRWVLKTMFTLKQCFCFLYCFFTIQDVLRKKGFIFFPWKVLLIYFLAITVDLFIIYRQLEPFFALIFTQAATNSAMSCSTPITIPSLLIGRCIPVFWVSRTSQSLVEYVNQVRIYSHNYLKHLPWNLHV